MSVHGSNSVNNSSFEIYSPTEINQLLDDRYVKSNTVKSIEKFSSPFIDQFKNVQFIQDSSKSNSSHQTSTLSDSITDFGTRVYFYVADLIENQDNILRAIVSNNINLQSLLEDCINRRLILDEEKMLLEDSSRYSPLEPNKNVYDIKARKAITQYRNQLIEDFNASFVADDNQSFSSNDINHQLELYIQARLPKFKSEVIDKFDYQYAEDYDTYASTLSSRNNSSQKLISIQHKHDREVILESVIQTYIRAITTILQLVKNVVKQNEHLLEILKGITILSTTKEEIVDPYNNHSLSGIYQILNDKYKKKSFVTLCNHLLHILSWQQTDDDIDHPERALVKMNTLLSNWTKQDLYSLMTKDIFFSACLIKGLSPKCSLKNTIIVEVIKHINKLETSSEDDQLYNSSNSNMPIYSFVSNLIQVDAESKKLLSPMKQVGTNPTTKQINNPPYNPNPNRYNNNRNNSYPKVEQASVSEVPEQVYENFNLKPFDKEITKSNNIFIKFNNRLRESIKKPYVALKTASLICPKCYPEDKSSTIPPCSNKCFAAQCQRCFLYGHATNLCLQSHDKDGKLLPKK